MAAIVGAVILGNIVGAVPAPADVESDVTAAVTGTLNVHIDTMRSGAMGYITVPVTAAILATLADGPCTVIISSGAGTVSQVVTQ
jgi:hypothetical protein